MRDALMQETAQIDHLFGLERDIDKTQIGALCHDVSGIGQVAQLPPEGRRGGAAALLGIRPTTLYSRLKKLGLKEGDW